MGHHHDLKGVMLAFLLLILVSCFAKYYTNIFGDYTYSDMKTQYELLFEMPWSEVEKFIRIDRVTGEAFADVNKLKEVLKARGKTIKDIHERYCRDKRIKVPFPQLVDYKLNAPVSLEEVLLECQEVQQY